MQEPVINFLKEEINSLLSHYPCRFCSVCMEKLKWMNSRQRQENRSQSMKLHIYMWSGNSVLATSCCPMWETNPIHFYETGISKKCDKRRISCETAVSWCVKGPCWSLRTVIWSIVACKWLDETQYVSRRGSWLNLAWRNATPLRVHCHKNCCALLYLHLW